MSKNHSAGCFSIYWVLSIAALEHIKSAMHGLPTPSLKLMLNCKQIVINFAPAKRAISKAKVTYRRTSPEHEPVKFRGTEGSCRFFKRLWIIGHKSKTMCCNLPTKVNSLSKFYCQHSLISMTVHFAQKLDSNARGGRGRLKLSNQHL